MVDLFVNDNPVVVFEQPGQHIRATFHKSARDALQQLQNVSWDNEHSHFPVTELRRGEYPANSYDCAREDLPTTSLYGAVHDKRVFARVGGTVPTFESAAENALVQALGRRVTHFFYDQQSHIGFFFIYDGTWRLAAIDLVVPC